MFPEGNLMGNMQKKRAIFTELDQTLPQLHFLIDKNASLHNPLEGNIYLVQYIIYIYILVYTANWVIICYLPPTFYV